jgi:hypothetical protein
MVPGASEGGHADIAGTVARGQGERWPQRHVCCVQVRWDWNRPEEGHGERRILVVGVSDLSCLRVRAGVGGECDERFRPELDSCRGGGDQYCRVVRPPSQARWARRCQELMDRYGTGDGRVPRCYYEAGETLVRVPEAGPQPQVVVQGAK